MTKRDFIITFILNRAMSDKNLEVEFWIEQADLAWNEIDKIAPDRSFTDAYV